MAKYRIELDTSNNGTHTMIYDENGKNIEDVNSLCLRIDSPISYPILIINRTGEEREDIIKSLIILDMKMDLLGAMLNFKFKWYDFLNPCVVFRYSAHIRNFLRNYNGSCYTKELKDGK